MSCGDITFLFQLLDAWFGEAGFPLHSQARALQAKRRYGKPAAPVCASENHRAFS